MHFSGLELSLVAKWYNDITLIGNILAVCSFWPVFCFECVDAIAMHFVIDPVSIIAEKETLNRNKSIKKLWIAIRRRCIIIIWPRSSCVAVHSWAAEQISIIDGINEANLCHVSYHSSTRLHKFQSKLPFPSRLYLVKKQKRGLIVTWSSRSA